MFKPKIQVSKVVHEKLKKAAEAEGCASVEEFAEKALEAAADLVLSEQGGDEQLSAEAVDDIANKLKGLGYLE